MRNEEKDGEGTAVFPALAIFILVEAAPILMAGKRKETALNRTEKSIGSAPQNPASKYWYKLVCGEVTFYNTPTLTGVSVFDWSHRHIVAGYPEFLSR